MLIQKAIKDITQLIEDQNRNIPAGGPIIASTALLGVALLKLAYNLSQAEWNTATKENLANFKREINSQKKELLIKMEADLIAYQENLASQFSNPEQLKSIIEVPLDIAKTSAKVLALATQLMPHLSGNIKSDAEIAIFNLKASIKGALSMVKANSQLLPATEPYLKQVKAEIAEIEKDIAD